MISRLCERAPQKDLEDGLYQYGVIFMVDN
jgi:hypothetical protein